MKRVSSAWVVDDDPTDIYLATYSLTASERFASVCASRDGLDFLARLQNPDLAFDLCPGEFPPRVVFLDIDMPRMDGFQVLRQLESLAAPLHNTTVIVLSATKDPGERQRAEDSPVVAAFLPKPLDERMACEVAEAYGTETG